MMSSRINLILKCFYKRPVWSCRLCSTVSQTTSEKDPAPLFFDRYVQDLLMKLTRIDYRKVFSARKDGTPLEVPKYKFMTDEELEAVRSKIATKARGYIQMPPVVRMRSDEEQILSKDPALQGFDECNIVFTDISFGGNNKDRLIVVRDTNGTLRHAKSNERHRINQVYYPIPGREIHTPQMFFSPHFDDLLDREEFQFILDRACLQFEPNDPEYHRVTRQVYSYVNKLKKYNALRSTRHFGPFAFHLTWEKNIDGLLLDLIESENIEEAAALIRLYQRLHPEAKSLAEPILNDIQLIQVYAELDAGDRYGVTRAIEQYYTMKTEKQKIEEGIKKAHGLTDKKNKPKT